MIFIRKLSKFKILNFGIIQPAAAIQKFYSIINLLYILINSWWGKKYKHDYESKRWYMLHLLFTLLKANKGPNYFYKPEKQIQRKITNPFALVVLILLIYQRCILNHYKCTFDFRLHNLTIWRKTLFLNIVIHKNFWATERDNITLSGIVVSASWQDWYRWG